jgi:hypothetical protein
MKAVIMQLSSSSDYSVSNIPLNALLSDMLTVCSTLKVEKEF